MRGIQLSSRKTKELMLGLIETIDHLTISVFIGMIIC